MARLTLSCLGPFEASLDGQMVRGFETVKARALLAYLADDPGWKHARSQLAGLLWPERPESSAMNNLRHTLANLRKAIGDREAHPPYLTIDRKTIGFNLSSQCEIDTHRFSQLLDRSNEKARPDSACMEQAASLYRGDFLEGFEVEDSPDLEEWILVRREAYRAMLLDALYDLAEGYLAKRDYERAIMFGRRQIAIEPSCEEAHRQVMAALAEMGRISEALAQFHACCQILSDELGVEPSQATRKLFEHIRDGETKLGSVPRGNLPASLSPLIGRERELEEIENYLRDPDCRLLSLVGPGGCGKTHLALEVASRQTRIYEDGSYFVPLASLESREMIPAAIAEAVGFTFLQGKDPVQQLLNYLRQKKLLLLLDNFEHILDGAGLLVEILEEVPSAKILVTSRFRLNLRDEQLFPVGGLQYPEHPCREPEEYAAVKLFLRSAHKINPKYDMVDRDREPIGEICRLVGGMPLEILLAAGWMGMLSPSEIAGELGRSSLEVMETDWLDVPDRQRSLRSVFDHSWKLLKDRERDVFAGLSVFRGSFTRQAAQAILGASMHDLRTLVDKSMLYHKANSRYEMHELLRQYAAWKLEQSPVSAEGIRERHMTFYLLTLDKQRINLYGSGYVVMKGEMEVDYYDELSAWQRALQTLELDQIEKGGDGLFVYYQINGLYQVGEQTFRSAMDKVKATIQSQASYVSDQHARIVAKLLAIQAYFTFFIGYTARSHQLLEESLSLLDKVSAAGYDIRNDQARALFFGGRLYITTNNDRAREMLDKSMSLSREIGNRSRIADILIMQSGVYQDAGLYPEMKRLLEECLAIRQELYDYIGIAFTRLALFDVYYNEGDDDKALSALSESLRTFREVGNRKGAADCLIRMGVLLWRTGKISEGQPFLNESLQIYKDMGDQDSIIWATLMVGLCEIHQGAYDKGREKILTNLEMNKIANDHCSVAECYLNMGRLSLVEDHLIESLNFIEDSLALYHHVGMRTGINAALAGLADVQRRLGHADLARQHLCDALELAIDIRDRDIRNMTLASAALFLLDRGEVEWAVEVYALADRSGHFQLSRLNHDLYGKYIAEAAARLATDVVESAEARGRELDIETTLSELLAKFKEEPASSRILKGRWG